MVWLCKTKIWWKAKLCYYLRKNRDIYRDIAEDVETRFDISNYELDLDHCLKEKWESNWSIEREIRWENNEKVCCVKSINI